MKTQIIVSGICKGKDLTDKVRQAFISARAIYTDKNYIERNGMINNDKKRSR